MKMPSITITDLQNAKADVDHIADLANSTEATATDRLGHVKRTIQGAVDAIDAQVDGIAAQTAAVVAANLAVIAASGATATTQAGIATTQAGIATTQAELATTNGAAQVALAAAEKVAAQTANTSAQAARDSINTTGKVFTAAEGAAAGIAATASGQQFAVLAADLLSWGVYRNNSGAALLLSNSYTKAYLDSIFTSTLSRSGYWGGIISTLGRMGIAFRQTDGRAILGVGGDIHGRMLTIEAAVPDPAGLANVVNTVSIVSDSRSGVLLGFVTPLGRLLAYFDSKTGRLKVFGRDILSEIDAIISSIGSSSSVAQDYPDKEWACWGDSLTAAGSSFWVALLATDLGVSIYNGGWGGQGYQAIAARQGGVPARLTATGNIIPASGSVTITTITYNPLSNGGSRLGSVAGVSGTLAMSSGGVITFTRSASGTSAACPVGTIFIPADAVAYRARTMTISTGRNSFNVLPAADIVTSIRAMIDYGTPRVKRVIVIQIPPADGETLPAASGSVRDKLNICNALIAAAFPEYYLNMTEKLQSQEAATAAGVIFNSQDLADIANGLIPTVFKADNVHHNATCGIAEKYFIKQFATSKGWI